MKKNKNILFTLYLCTSIGVLTFFVLWSILQYLDDTPKWGRVYMPPAIVLNEEFTATVQYSNLVRPVMLSAIISWQTKENKFEGRVEAYARRPVVYDSGEYVFRFPPLKKNIITFVRVTVEIYEIPSDPSISLYYCKSAGELIGSDWTPAVLTKDEASVIAANTNSILSLLKTSWQQGYWRFALNDRTPARIAVTILYIFLAAGCAYILFSMKTNKSKVESSPESSLINDEKKWFWVLLIVILIMLGINKQLDLQTLAVDFMKTVSKARGWYAIRRSFQINVMSAIAGCSAALLTFVIIKMRKLKSDTIPALVGIIMLLGFIILRGISLHMTNTILYRQIAGFRLYGWMEFVSLAFIAYSIIKKVKDILKYRINS